MAERSDKIWIITSAPTYNTNVPAPGLATGNQINGILAINPENSIINTTGSATTYAAAVAIIPSPDTAQTKNPPHIINATIGITAKFAKNPPNVNMLKKYAVKNTVERNVTDDKARLSGMDLCIFMPIRADTCRFIFIKRSASG